MHGKAQSAVRQYGAGARASRLVSGQCELHRHLEDDLAAFKGTEKALVFSSGWAANVGAICSLARRGDALFCDKRNHASLIDACRLISADGARVRYYTTLEKLTALVIASDALRKIIVSDAVYSMDGDLADLPALLALAHEHGCVLFSERFISASEKRRQHLASKPGIPMDHSLNRRDKLGLSGTGR